MKKMNKLISFVCSAAMLSTSLAGVITASAEETDAAQTTEITQGIELIYNEEESTSTSAVIEVYARGVAYLDAIQASFILPEGAVYDTSANTANLIVTDSPLSPTVTYSEGSNMYTVGGYASATLHDAVTNPLVATVTIPFASALESDVTLTLTGASSLSGYSNSDMTGDYTELTLTAGNMPAASVVVSATPGEEEPTETAAVETEAPAETEAPVETATPYPVTRPTMVPVPTAEPEATAVPTAEPVEQGIELVYNKETSTSTAAVIEVYARGVSYLDAIQASFILPEGAVYDTSANTANLIVSDSPLSPTVTYSEESKMYTVGGYASATLHDAITNPLVATVTIPFASALESDVTLTLTGASSLSGYSNSDMTGDYTELTLSAGNMPATFVVVLADPNPVATETPETTETPSFDNDGEIALGDIITDAPATDETNGKLIAVVVNVTKADGSEAVYGTDFVAEFDGKELTEDEYKNIINGYTEPDMTKVISGLTFLVNNGVSVSAAPAYQTTEQESTGDMTVVPGLGGSQTYEDAPSTQTPAPDGTYALTVSVPSNGTITVSYKDAEGNTQTASTADGRISVNVPAGTEVDFTAIPKANYTFTKWTGALTSSTNPTSLTVNRNSTVSATFTRAGSSNNNSSSSSSGTTSGNTAGGGIARPNGGTTTITSVNFQDLGSVTWAQAAINYLASAGIINGRSSTVFDPNASVTRAEFAKMVCATFGIVENTSAAQTFTDVSPSDWFYGYVQAAAAAGIVNGVSATEFDPNATIKRQEMAAMLYRAIDATGNLSKLPAGTAKDFADYNQIDDYAKGYVTTLSSAGVINGTSDTTFDPYATATRAQAAAILYQYLSAVGYVQ